MTEVKTPKNGNTLSWEVPKSTSLHSSSGKFTMAMKIYVPWWKRKTLWILVGAVALLIFLQIDIDTGGSVYGLIKMMFNWVRTQPWLTMAVGGGIGYFVRDRAIQLVSRHELLPDLEKK